MTQEARQAPSQDPQSGVHGPVLASPLKEEEVGPPQGLGRSRNPSDGAKHWARD